MTDDDIELAMEEIIQLRKEVADFVGPPDRYITDSQFRRFIEEHAPKSTKPSGRSTSFTPEEDEAILTGTNTTRLVMDLNRSATQIWARRSYLKRHK